MSKQDELAQARQRCWRVIASVALTVAIFKDDLLKIYGLTDGSWGVDLAFLIGLIVISVALDRCVEASIDASPLIRRLIAGKRHIEGLWINITSNKEETTIHNGSIVAIEYRDGRHHLDGESFDGNGSRVGSLRTVTTDYDSDRLDYVYVAEVTSHHQTVNGFGYSTFQRLGRLPLRAYHGTFAIDGVDEEYIVDGKLITDRGEIKMARTEAGRGELVRRYIEAKLAQMARAGREISVYVGPIAMTVEPAPSTENVHKLSEARSPRQASEESA